MDNIQIIANPLSGKTAHYVQIQTISEVQQIHSLLVDPHIVSRCMYKQYPKYSKHTLVGRSRYCMQFTTTHEVYIHLLVVLRHNKFSLLPANTMFICGQMYSTYIQLWKFLKCYRTYMKINAFTITSEEALETRICGFPKSIYRITEVTEA